jgi:Domain of unknown function (DUF6265)
MRKIYLLLMLTLSSHVLTAQSTSKKTTDNFGKLQWMLGTWTRTTNEPGQSGIESWSKVSSGEFLGKGITMKGTDTLFVEKLKLIIKDDDIYYVSDVPENPSPVSFKITGISSNGFTCENPSHDFPKKISYQLNGKSLKATISGDGKTFDFFFEKK